MIFNEKCRIRIKIQYNVPLSKHRFLTICKNDCGILKQTEKLLYDREQITSSMFGSIKVYLDQMVFDVGTTVFFLFVFIIRLTLG